MVKCRHSFITVVWPLYSKVLRHNNNFLDRNENSGLLLSSCDLKLVNCLNWQDEDVSAHRSGVFQCSVVHWRSDYIYFMKRHSGFHVCWTILTSFPKVTASSTHETYLCMFVVLLNSWTLSFHFLAFCNPNNKREWTTLAFTLIPPKENLTFSVSPHQQLAQSTGSATAGQKLGCHVGLICSFSGLKVECLNSLAPNSRLWNSTTQRQART